jgi:acyl carrier protein
MNMDLNTLTHWMKEYLSELIGEPLETIDIEAPLSYFDLDSIDAVNMALTLGEVTGVDIHPGTFLDDNSSISDLSHIVQEYIASSQNNSSEKPVSHPG